MPLSEQGWIGWDLDGSLAYYDHWRGVEHIGDPIPDSVALVRAQLAEGKDVRIFTARLCNKGARKYIRRWCKTFLGKALPITNKKDRYMIELYDDRAFHVVPNEGRVIRP